MMSKIEVAKVEPVFQKIEVIKTEHNLFFY